MRFRYRFVPYGTDFVACGGTRGTAALPAHQLFGNELAVDVGGTCWAHSGETRQVIDHHFDRDQQFPSAAAAVLHLAARIRAALLPHALEPDGVWLVTHQYPDFDAFCSAYLAHNVVAAPLASDWERLGIAHDVWKDVAPATHGSQQGVRRIDWFSPSLEGVDAEHRWPVLLAACAAVVDQGRRMHCPRTRALHSVLYAALTRGRDYLAEAHGATEFFDAVRASVRGRGLHPLFDDVLGDNPEFAPELALLDREEPAYRRDVARARCSVISLPTTSGADRLAAVQMRTPLLDDRFERRSEHTLRDATILQTDGIWIRDPECLLFKEWARQDSDHSTLGEGFLFTAVAYSNGRPGARVNDTEYFFAIDQERAGGRHLYSVWAALQAGEVRTLAGPGYEDLRKSLESALLAAQNEGQQSTCRPEFEGRAGSLEALFDDPWFDGHNYQCTIVATPNRGTFIGSAGRASDLSDDPIAKIVQSEVEGGVFLSAPYIKDFQSADFAARLRFVRIGLRDGVAVTRGGFAHQTGRALWATLEPDSGGSVPSDFEARHLLVDGHTVLVWSRRGVAVAHDRLAEQRAQELETQLERIARLSWDIERLVQKPPSQLETQLVDGERLLREVLAIKHQFAAPYGRPLRRLFEALSFDQALDGLRDLVLGQKIERNVGTVAAVQLKVEWIEILIVSFYAAHLTHLLSETLWHEHAERIVILTVTFSLAAGTLAAWSLQPWHHTSSKRILVAPLALVLALMLWLALATYQLQNPTTPELPPNGTPATIPRQPSDR